MMNRLYKSKRANEQFQDEKRYNMMNKFYQKRQALDNYEDSYMGL